MKRKHPVPKSIPKFGLGQVFGVRSRQPRPLTWWTLLPSLFGTAFSLILLMPFDANAQSTWQDAPAPIADMLDSRWFPAVKISPNHRWMVRLERPTFLPIELLAQPRVQIAGIRLNPKTRGPAMEYAFEQMVLQDLKTGAIYPLELPEKAQIRNLHWPPVGNYLAFTLTKTTGIELWVVEAETATARPLTPPRLNNTYGQPCFWISEAQGLLCKLVPFGQPTPPAAPLVPAAPRIEENLGREVPQRTHTNLLQSPHDEALFEYYLRSESVPFGKLPRYTWKCHPSLTPALSTSRCCSSTGQRMTMLAPIPARANDCLVHYKDWAVP
jgi:hypothetical protein